MASRTPVCRSQRKLAETDDSRVEPDHDDINPASRRQACHLEY